MADNGNAVLPDGSIAFDGGVDSIVPTTVASSRNPNGLKRNQLAWMGNATVRDGGISPRQGYNRLGQIFSSLGLFQGAFIYTPLFDTPYLIVCISGRVLKVVPGTPPTITDLTAQFPGTGMPAINPYFYFCQGEEYLVIQAGDNVTLPLFWDGTTLRRSKGITNTGVAPGTPNVNEIPAATAMVYYMGRLWYAQGRQYSAGDIVGGNSGSGTSGNRGAILEVTENPLVLGGGGFTVPTNAGNIRCFFYNGQLNAQLGQGQLMIGTRQAVYALQVPVSRLDWINANSNNAPTQTVVQLINGPVNDRSVVPVNGDIFYQSLEPGIRSLFASVRYFDQWGNIQISAPVNRITQFNNRALLSNASGMLFNNRLFQTALPLQLAQGVIHQAVIPYDFIPISSLGGQRSPNWEGHNEGLQYLQLLSADFNGLERGFAIAVSALDNSIELWEFTQAGQFDSNRTDPQARITWFAEFPAYVWKDDFTMKHLQSAELWVDRLYGECVFQMDFRPDGTTCWLPWHKWKACSTRNSSEDLSNPISYPITTFGEGNKYSMVLPKPPFSCQSLNGRPADIGYQFQVRLTVTGFCRLRGLLLYAANKEKPLYQGIVC